MVLKTCIASHLARSECLLRIFIYFTLFLNLTAQNGDIILFNKRLETFFAVDDSVTKSDWLEALPKQKEIIEMKSLIRKLFKYDTFRELNGSSVLKFYSALEKDLKITVIQNEYCVIHEKFPSASSTTQRFPRFWGYVVVASKRVAKRRYLHHSAPHFLTDGQVCAQSAAMFQYTNARSLVVAGASRFAVIGRPDSECQPGNGIADAAHDNRTMFHAMCSGVWAASRLSSRRPGRWAGYRRRNIGRLTQRRNRKRQNVYIQWHGMAKKTCGNIAVYGSAGVIGSNGVYNDENAAVNKIVSYINYVMGRRLAETPATANCILKATTNIFGRLINGVPADDVCAMPTTNPMVRGQFVHLEQKNWIIENWDIWKIVLLSAFPA